MIRLLIFIFMAGLGGAPAWACDCVRLIPGSPHFARDLDAVIADSAVIAEGVLIAPDTFRATRVLRGPRRARFAVGGEIGVISDCTLHGVELERRVGQHTLILLRGGPDVYEVSRCPNFQTRAVENAIRRRLRAAPRRPERASAARAGCSAHPYHRRNLLPA